MLLVPAGMFTLMFRTACHDALRSIAELAIVQAQARSTEPGSGAPGTIELRHTIGDLDTRLRMLNTGLWRTQLKRHVADPSRYTEAERVNNDLRQARETLRERSSVSLPLLDGASSLLSQTAALLGEDEAIIAYVIGNDFELFRATPLEPRLRANYILQQALVVRRSGLSTPCAGAGAPRSNISIASA